MRAREHRAQKRAFHLVVAAVHLIVALTNKRRKVRRMHCHAQRPAGQLDCRRLALIWEVAPRSILRHYSTVSSVVSDAHQVTTSERREKCQQSSA
jgi:hypothetical protein